MKTITAFTWDNAKGEDHNGKSLIVGQILEKRDPESESVHVYGISLGIVDTAKDLQLKRYSCHRSGVEGELKILDKETLRNILYDEVDKALEILFDPAEMHLVEEQLNQEPEETGQFEGE